MAMQLLTEEYIKEKLSMRKILPRLIVSFLILQGFFLASPSAAYAEEMTCPSHILVDVDVKPGETPNKINLSGKGLLPVAVITTQEFNASQFTPEMAHLSDASTAMDCSGPMAVRWNYSDVNKDGLVDLVFFFPIQDLNLTSTTTEVMLMAHGSYESQVIHIMGTDSVVVKP